MRSRRFEKQLAMKTKHWCETVVLTLEEIIPELVDAGFRKKNKILVGEFNDHIQHSLSFLENEVRHDLKKSVDPLMLNIILKNYRQLFFADGVYATMYCYLVMSLQKLTVNGMFLEEDNPGNKLVVASAFVSMSTLIAAKSSIDKRAVYNSDLCKHIFNKNNNTCCTLESINIAEIKFLSFLDHRAPSLDEIKQVMISAIAKEIDTARTKKIFDKHRQRTSNPNTFFYVEDLKTIEARQEKLNRQPVRERRAYSL